MSKYLINGILLAALTTFLSLLIFFTFVYSRESVMLLFFVSVSGGLTSAYQFSKYIDSKDKRWDKS